jgi:hypothetical protein
MNSTLIECPSPAQLPRPQHRFALSGLLLTPTTTPDIHDENTIARTFHRDTLFIPLVILSDLLIVTARRVLLPGLRSVLCPPRPP